MKDFFISYNGADKKWAGWIAWTLEEAGYNTVIQAWDFRPGRDFVLEMQRAASGTERTMALLSENYLKADYIQDQDPDVREVAVWALGKVASPKVVPCIEDTLADAHPKVRSAAVFSVENLLLEEDRHRLLGLVIYDTDPSVQGVYLGS